MFFFRFCLRQHGFLHAWFFGSGCASLRQQCFLRLRELTPAMFLGLRRSWKSKKNRLKSTFSWAPDDGNPLKINKNQCFLKNSFNISWAADAGNQWKIDKNQYCLMLWYFLVACGLTLGSSGYARANFAYAILARPEKERKSMEFYWN